MVWVIALKEDKSIKIIVLLKEKYYYALSHNEEIEITENEFLDLEKDTIPIERRLYLQKYIVSFIMVII